MKLNVVSMSGGKDSTATAIVAFETEPRETIRLVFADTGNEHQITYDQIDYLESFFGVPIIRLRRSFAGEIARKRAYVREKWPEKGVPLAVIERALVGLVASGNPYLDLCLWKGRFPSRMAQFCTQFLKTEPLVEYQMGLIDSGETDTVWSWQGIRAEESARRRYALSHEEVGGGLWIERPILRWSAEDTFAAHEAYGIQPNPLYTQGMSRVGCMPCINASKNEILAISKRFPEEIERVAEWESIVSGVAKRASATFFHHPDNRGNSDASTAFEKGNVYQVVKWSQTSRGGKQPDLFRIADAATECSSSYGLCE